MIIESIRQKAGSWWFRSFLALLALTLAFLWYGGDLTTGISTGRMTLIVVGDEKIGFSDFKRSLDRQLSRFQGNFDQKIGADDIKRFYPVILSNLVQEKLLTQEAKRLGILAPDSQVRQVLMDMPVFQGPSGRFDRTLFDRALSHLGVTENRFVEDLRLNLMQTTLLGGLFQGIHHVPVSPSIGQKLFSAVRQTRTVSVVVVPSQAMALDTIPTAQDLKSLYGEYAQTRFKAPEYRDIQWLVFDGSMIKDPMTVTDAEIASVYDSRPDDFKGLKKSDRDNRIRLDLQTQKRHEKLYALTAQIDDAIAGGASLEELAKTYGLSIKEARHVAGDGSFDPYAFEKDKVPPALAADGDGVLLKEAFALGEGTTGNVVEVGEGQYILPRVNRIYPAHARPYDQVSSAVKDLWTQRAQEKAAGKLAQTIQSELSGTAAPSSTASKKRLKTVKVILNRAGPVGPSLLSFQGDSIAKIFTLRPQQTLVVPMVNDKNRLDFLVARLEAITPPKPSQVSKKKDDDFETFKTQIKGQIAVELAQQYTQSLEKRFPIKENKEALLQLSKIRFE